MADSVHHTISLCCFAHMCREGEVGRRGKTLVVWSINQHCPRNCWRYGLATEMIPLYDKRAIFS